MTEALLQRLSELDAAVVERGLSAEAHAEGLRIVRAHLTRFAWLEKQLLGGVSFPLPLHALSKDLPHDVLAAAEFTAVRERKRLGLDTPEAGDVMEVLDRDGLKVYRAPFPEDSPLRGFFLFDPDVGPAFVTARGLDPLTSDAVMAQLLGHYLLDVDPYTIRLAVEDAPTSEELRARAFAAAFLVPRAELDSYLKAAGVAPDAEIPIEQLQGLALYFEVTLETLVARLLALGRLPAERVAGILAAPRPLAPPFRTGAAVGERFVRLALEAHARHLIDVANLAQYLEVTSADARRLASRFSLPTSP